MKKSNNSTVIILASIAVILIIGALAYFLSGPSINWSINYLPKEKSPYGTHIIKSVLQKNGKDRAFEMIEDSVHLQLKHTDDAPSTYVYIGDYYYGNKKDIDSLLAFVRAGNTAYLLSEGLSSSNMYTFLQEHIIGAITYDEPDYYDENEDGYEDEYTGEEEIYYEEQDTFEDETIIGEEEYDPYSYLKDIQYFDYVVDTRGTLTHQSSKIKAPVNYIVDFDTVPYSWVFLNEDIFSHFYEDQVEVLGTFKEGDNKLIRDKINYFRIKIGSGYLYINTQPLAFTNIHMLNEKNMQYAREVFADIPDGKIYWDEENRTMDRIKREKNNPGMPDEGPLEFILSEPALRKAWYVLLAGLLLYLIFGARRKQRVIPILERKDNTSIEYAEVISQLFLEQTDHTKLVSLKTELFRSFVRDRFNIKITDETTIDDNRLILNLSTRTNVPADLIRSILKEEILLRSHTVIDTYMMLSYHRKLEEFYSLSK